MRVPNSPHNMRRVVTEPAFKTDMDDVLMRPPKPTYTSRVKDGKITVGVEAFLTETDVNGKENRNPGSSYHRSRERTRQPAVLRRVERKLAQKEKEKERDRASRGGEYSSLTRDYVRDRSWSRSECGSVRSSSVNGSTTEHIASYRHRTARSCSGSRPDAATTKTYITIGPGKPTRIREHSPSKAPKEEKSRDKSPTKKRSDLLLGSSTPLKSTELFRDISNGKLSDQDNNNNSKNTSTRKTSFTTQKTFIINGDQLGRRLSIDLSTDDDEVLPSAEKQPRASPESDQGFRSVSSCSNFSSNFSGSTDSVESSTSDRENHLSKRRISLEQRFRARVNRVPSPERNNQDGFSGSASSRLLYNLSSGYRYHRATVSSNSGRQPFRRFSQDHQRDLQKKQEATRSRKISLPQSYYQAQDYQYKSFTTLSAERWAYIMSLTNYYSGGGIRRTSGGGSRISDLTSKYKLCDDTFFFAGCCAEHDRIGLSNLKLKTINPSLPLSNNNLTGDGPFSYPIADDDCDSSSVSGSSCFSDSCGADEESVSSDDTVYESDSEAKPRRDCRSTSPPSRNLTPVVSEDGSYMNEISSRRLPATAEGKNTFAISGGNAKHLKDARKKCQKSGSNKQGRALASDHDDTPSISDMQSVSTVSGSGMDFFRKFVQRKSKGCKECENQFRREVLIDRLVSDCRVNSSMAETTSSLSLTSSYVETPLTSHRCPSHQGYGEPGIMDDVRSVSTKSSISTVSGSGVLFLRNYLKKKNKGGVQSTPGHESANSSNRVFNSIPIPFPPPQDFYGPVYIPDALAFYPEDEQDDYGRRGSIGSTIADLLNETFDSEDSELRNLDWDDWDDPSPEQIDYSIEELEFDEDNLEDIDPEGRVTVVRGDEMTDITTDKTNDSRLEEMASTPKMENGMMSADEGKEEDKRHEAVRCLSTTLSRHMRQNSDVTESSGHDRSSKISVDSFQGSDEIKCILRSSEDENEKMSPHHPPDLSYVDKMLEHLSIPERRKSSCDPTDGAVNRPLSVSSTCPSSKTSLPHLTADSRSSSSNSSWKSSMTSPAVAKTLTTSTAKITSAAELARNMSSSFEDSTQQRLNYHPPLANSERNSTANRMPFVRHSSSSGESNKSSSVFSTANDFDTSSPPVAPMRSNSRLTDFWERSILNSDVDNTATPVIPKPREQRKYGRSRSDGIVNLEKKQSSFTRGGFRPAMRDFYDPDGHAKANERIQHFKNVTRLAAADQSLSSSFDPTPSASRRSIRSPTISRNSSGSSFGVSSYTERGIGPYRRYV